MESDSDCITYVEHDLFPRSFSIMEEIRRQGKFCDVTLKVGECNIKAHKIVLSATIPYFYAMFTADMVESTEVEITLHEVEPQILESLINFSYSGKILIDFQNVHSIIVGASYLLLNKVKDACANFLSERLQVGTVLGTNKFADTFNCLSLIEACQKYIQEHFHEVSFCDEFYNLSAKEVGQLLDNDELHVSSEEQVFEALMRWIEKDPEVRKEHLPLFLSKVRLSLLSPEYLTYSVAKAELIKTSHACRDLVDEAKDCHLIPQKGLLFQSFKSQPRCCKSITGLILAVGGLTESGESLATVELYNPVIGHWCSTTSMTTLRSRVGVAVMNKNLYAIGGYDGMERLDTVEVFESDGNSWFTISSMHCRRSAGGAAALKDKVYVCGGYDGISSLDSVECYDPELGSWMLITPMMKHRSACGVVTLDGHLYALGGHNGLTIFNLVERYDPNTGNWTEVTPMLTKRCRLGAASLNGKLYACGGYDGSTFSETVEMYDPKDNMWRMIAPMNTKRSRVALISNMGKLWAIGGYDGVSNLSTVEIYDPKLNEWTFGPSMCAHEGGVGVGVVSLP